MKIIVYSTATMRAIGALEGSDGSVQANIDALPQGCGYLVVAAGEVTDDPSNYKIENGAAIHSPRPSPIHILDAGGQWVDPRTLADLKLTKNAEINAARLAANRGTFTFAGKQIACDELSRSDIDGFNGIVSLTGTLPPDWIGFWKTADNDYLAIPDVATWTGLYAAMVAQGQANFAHSQALKAALAAAATAAEVEAIVW
jgi:hypothetical protein